MKMLKIMTGVKNSKRFIIIGKPETPNIDVETSDGAVAAVAVELRVNGRGGNSVVVVLCDGNIVAVDNVRKKTNTSHHRSEDAFHPYIHLVATCNVC